MLIYIFFAISGGSCLICDESEEKGSSFFYCLTFRIRYYNRRHHRRGYFWGERFKSVIVENGNTLINCLAYTDLDPVRAWIVAKPEDYRWNSLGYHVQTENKDEFLLLDYGLKEFNVLDAKERFRRYRRFVYEKALKGHQIPDKTMNKERKRKFELSKINRFTHRTRYFTDSGIIGTRDLFSQPVVTIDLTVGFIFSECSYKIVHGSSAPGFEASLFYIFSFKPNPRWISSRKIFALSTI